MLQWKYKFIHFYKCMQTIKLRQTTENNGGPCTSKNYAKGVPWASKGDAKGSWPSVNMWRVGSENELALFIILLSLLKKLSLLNQERNMHRSSTIYKRKQFKTVPVSLEETSLWITDFWKVDSWKLKCFTDGFVSYKYSAFCFTRY